MQQEYLRLIDGFSLAFKAIRIYSREVMMEQMSKAGNAVKKGMRDEMRQQKGYTTTRVGSKGAYLQRTPLVEYGHRESLSNDNMTSAPSSMSSFIDSFLMEKSETLVVGGMHPRFRPVIRRDGKIVGIGSHVSAVGSRTTAILHHMDTGEEIPDYDRRTMLYKGKDNKPRHFMTKGINTAMPQVRKYLEDGFVSVLDKALSGAKIDETEKKIG